jgi:hypothetical protein
VATILTVIFPMHCNPYNSSPHLPSPYPIPINPNRSSHWKHLSLSLKVGAASHDGNAVIHHPFTNTQVFVNGGADIFRLDLVGAETVDNPLAQDNVDYKKKDEAEK